MSQGDAPTSGFCPTCGAQNPAGATRCAVCGQPLAKREDIDRLWGREPDKGTGGEIIDLYPVPDPSLQTTTPFTQTRPFDPADYREAAAPPAAVPARASGRTPPSSAGRPAAVASAPPPPLPAAKPGGPPGCVLGCLAFVLIGIVAAVVLWGGIKPLLSDRVEDDLAVGIANELRTVDRIQAPSNGQIVLTEDQINADLDRYADRYEPVTDARVAITADGAVVAFKIYRVSSTFRGGLAVENGRIVVTDPTLSGVASRAIDIDDVANILEREANDLLDRSGLEPTGVRLRDGVVVITTAPKTTTSA